MIQHVVLFKLKSVITSAEKQTLIARLHRLADEIDSLLRLEVHSDILGLADSFDLGLFVTLADRASLQRYGENQARQAVSAYARSLCDQVVLFDYETGEG